MSDDGVGVKVVERLKRDYRFPESVTLLDGGTLGLDLLPRLEGIGRLLILDAMETGKAPGTLVRLTGDEIPAAFATKLSPHQMGLQDLLAVAHLQGIVPPEMVMWGVQPTQIAIGTELSEPVAAQVDIMVETALHELSRWGVEPEPA